jgi:hypothetical protein
MITDEQINNLKPGDKLIFVSDGRVLSAKKGNVFTFANWWEPKCQFVVPKTYWQCKELHDMGNHGHNFSIRELELFDENVHTEFVLMDRAKLRAHQMQFLKEYGD